MVRRTAGLSGSDTLFPSAAHFRACEQAAQADDFRLLAGRLAPARRYAVARSGGLLDHSDVALGAVVLEQLAHLGLFLVGSRIGRGSDRLAQAFRDPHPIDHVAWLLPAVKDLGVSVGTLREAEGMIEIGRAHV